MPTNLLPWLASDLLFSSKAGQPIFISQSGTAVCGCDFRANGMGWDGLGRKKVWGQRDIRDPVLPFSISLQWETASKRQNTTLCLPAPKEWSSTEAARALWTQRHIIGGREMQPGWIVMSKEASIQRRGKKQWDNYSSRAAPNSSL